MVLMSDSQTLIRRSSVGGYECKRASIIQIYPRAIEKAQLLFWARRKKAPLVSFYARTISAIIHTLQKAIRNRAMEKSKLKS